MTLSIRELYAKSIKAYRDELGWTVVDGRTSSMKGLAAVFLARLGIMDAETFLKDFATTFYVPGTGIVCFVPWFPDPASGKPEDMPISPRTCLNRLKTLAHEAQHGFQIKDVGWLKFSLDYLLRSGKRAEWETEAYRIQILLERYWDLREERVRKPREEPVASRLFMVNYVRSIVRNSLSHYSLSSTQLAVAESELLHHATQMNRWRRWRSWNLASTRTIRILLHAD